MATRTVVCPECGADVPSGRLSCVACGTLIASVAGAARRVAVPGPGPSTGSGDAPASPVDAVDAAAASSQDVHDAADARDAAIEAAREEADARDAAIEAAREGADEPPVPPILRDWTGPVPPSALDATDLAPAVPPGPAIPSRATDLPPDVLIAAADAPPAVPSPAAMGRPDLYAPARASHDTGPAAFARSEDEPAWPPAPAVPGAYVAPTIVPTAAATVHGRPATASSIAAASIAEGTVTSIPAAPRQNRWFSVPDQATGGSGAAPGKAGLFSDLPFRTPGGAPAWAVSIGSLFGAVAFLLPTWAANGVIGTQGDQTWTGQWGLANTANLVPWAVTIAVLLLTLIPSRIPASIRGVVIPILVGGWLLGIVWIYATTAFGLGWGVDALAIGGLLLVIGGAVGAWRDDEAPAGPDRDPGAA